MRMQNTFTLASLMLLFALTIVYGQAQKQTSSVASAPKIGVIKKPLIDGCGCTLQLPEDYRKHNERAIFLHDYSDTVQMNIDGKDVRLKLISESPKPQKVKVGSRRKEIYSVGKDRIEIEYVVTKVCPSKDDRDDWCEATWYSATITVIRDKQSQQIKALGLCGC